jgi:protein-S-isoprenylcysteine O-methyltransferase Ste14
MDDREPKQATHYQGGWVLWFRGLFRILLIVGVMAGILFLAAGRLDWPAAWLLTILYFFYLLYVMIWGFRNAPDLLHERSRVASNVKSWDRLVNVLYALLVLSLLIIAGLDAGRFRWSQMPLGFQAMGLLGMSWAGWAIWWTIAENTFASRWARIQADRGQVVISSGPYHYVRHPMYASLIFLFPCVSLELGSWWGCIPAGLIILLFISRTTLEDRMLQDELPGYREYAAQVPYRLIPRIW